MLEPRPFHIRFFLLQDFSHIAFSCAIEPLRIANYVAERELYQWSLASEDGKRAICSNGIETKVSAGMEPAKHLDRLFLISGLNVRRHVTPALLSFVRREHAHGTSLGAICSAAYVLARARLLDGMEAAVHWAFHDVFAEEFPQVLLTRGVFVAHTRILSASGGTAAADLMLHLIAREHGRDFANIVADQMVYNTVRDASAAQRVSMQARYGRRNARLQQAVALMQDCLEETITASDIAAEVGFSTRQLERLFRRYLSASPLQYLTELRLDRARVLLLQTEHSVTEVAVACGFGSTSYFSRLFRKRYGKSPLAFRAMPLLSTPEMEPVEDPLLISCPPSEPASERRRGRSLDSVN